MFVHIRHLAFAFLIALVLPGDILAQEELKKTVEPPSGNSVVIGRLVFEDTGSPAPRYRIQLIPTHVLVGPRSGFRMPTAITNENGEFSLKRVEAGEYYVVPQAIDARPGSSYVYPFIGLTTNRAGDNERVEQFKKDHTRISVDGQHNLTVNLRVKNPNFGSISGRVIDSSGAPAVRAKVHLMSKGEIVFGASVTTNEQGQFKIPGLPAGEYIVGASPPVKEPADGVRKPFRFEGILGATFFPSTLESKKSPPVAVFSDRDTGNIDITLLARSLHTLSGTIRHRDTSQAVPNATIHLTPIGFSTPRPTTPRKPDIETGMSRYSSSTDSSGRWSIANVPDGLYRLRVETSAGPQASSTRFVSVEQQLNVQGADIEDLAIEVSSGSRISGVVTVEGESAELQFINLSAARRKGNASSHDRLNGSGNFALTSVAAGEIVFSAFPFPQEKFYPKSIEVNGVDLLRTNLNLAEGEEINDVRIVISSNVGVITGRVHSEKTNQPLKGVKVMLMRVNRDGLRLFGGRLTTETDEKGNYLLSAAPGVYRVVAWQLSDGPDAYRVALERASQAQGSGLTLLPNDRKQQDLWIP